MEKTLCPISRIVVPLDASVESTGVVKYVGSIAAPFGDSIEQISLIHVIGSGYFTSHAGYTDLRVLRLEESEAFKRIKEMHYEADIFPIFDEATKILKSLGVSEARIHPQIRHGKEWKEVIEYAKASNASCIIMGRRVMDEDEPHPLGAIAQGVIQRAGGFTVYLVGRRALDHQGCPIPRAMVALDGSPSSKKALEHALYMAAAIKGVSELKVISVRGFEPVNAEEIFKEAKEVAGRIPVPEGLLRFSVRDGDAAKEILKEAAIGDYSIIFMARGGLSGQKNLPLGGVALSVIHRAIDPTIALVS